MKNFYRNVILTGEAVSTKETYTGNFLYENFDLHFKKSIFFPYGKPQQSISVWLCLTQIGILEGGCVCFEKQARLF